MKLKNFLLVSCILLLGILFTLPTFAQSDIPVGLQKIIDYNNNNALDFSVKISFFIAFIAGVLGVLSPCILPFLPAYFSYTFKEKRNITKMTLVFFMGFSAVFVAMGIIAGFVGQQTLIFIQKDWLVMLAGIFMVVLGLVVLRGKKVCSYFNPRKDFRNDNYGTFIFGIFFAIGWTACLGPILAGILGIGVILGNIFYSAILMLFYSLGNLVPLFILSIFYDKYNLSESRFIKGKMLSFAIGSKHYAIHSTNLISGLLFTVFGAFLIIFRGTTIINKFDIFGTRDYFYSAQRWLINWQYANILGIAALAIFILIIGLFLWRRRK